MWTRRAILAVLALAITGAASMAAAEPSASTPVGYWKTIDDKTGQARSIVQIREESGELHGRVAKLFIASDKNQDPICAKCEGARKNQHVQGMEILWGFKRQQEGWGDGWVLDPQEGKTYHANIEVLEGGKKLKLFGYVRVIVKIGRSQTWERVKPEDFGL